MISKRSSGHTALGGVCCLLVCAGLFANCVVGPVRSSEDTTPPRPNVVVILADDLGYSDIGAYGGEIRTPALDALAASGLRYSQFYNAGRCCPTRASLLTGRYPHEVGVGRMVRMLGSTATAGPYQGFLSTEVPTVAEALRELGYGTYLSGKWHVGEEREHWPRRRGFDRYWGLISGASSYYEIIRNQLMVRQMVLDDEHWEPPNAGFYMTDATTDYAIDFVEGHVERRADAPFFLYVAYTAPHWPLHALPEDMARYEGRYDEGWDALRAERFERQREIGLVDDRYELPPRPEAVPPWEDVEDKARWSRLMEVYAAMVDRMDQGIGRLMAALERVDARENTIVIFLSDNGACAESVEGRRLNDPEAAVGARGSYLAYREPWAYASNTPLRLYKQWMHEGGIATPFVVSWPAGLGDGNGEWVREPAHIIELMPSFLKLAGATEEREGVARLLGTTGVTKDTGVKTYFWEHMKHRAIRRGDWKLAWDRNVGAWELYDLSQDPTEMRDLSDSQPELVGELADAWAVWARSVGVDAPM